MTIAGLIFLMVFIALPALQRSQRNTQRRDDYSMLVTSINCITDPTKTSSDGCGDNGWKDPKQDDPGSQVFVIIRANCTGKDPNGDPKPASDSAARSFAVYGYLEGGGYFCQASNDNQNT